MAQSGQVLLEATVRDGVITTIETVSAATSMSTKDASHDGRITTEHAFSRALNDVIHSAVSNGVEVRGGWRVDGADGTHDLGVEIYRVVTGSTEDS